MFVFRSDFCTSLPLTVISHLLVLCNLWITRQEKRRREFNPCAAFARGEPCDWETSGKTARVIGSLCLYMSFYRKTFRGEIGQKGSRHCLFRFTMRGRIELVRFQWIQSPCRGRTRLGLDVGSRGECFLNLKVDLGPRLNIHKHSSLSL